MKRRRKYPHCQHYRDKRHRFGINNLSFAEVCMFRDGNPDDTCKCGFDRKDWHEARLSPEALVQKVQP